MRLEGMANPPCSEQFYDLEVADGLWVTSAVRSVCFEMRYARNHTKTMQIVPILATNGVRSEIALATLSNKAPRAKKPPRIYITILLALWGREGFTVSRFAV